MSSLRGKVTIITGASSGLGAEFARYFASHGAKLSLSGRNEERLERVAEECVALGLDRASVHTVVGDITDEMTTGKIARRTVEHFGRIDILINNAGIGAGPNQDMEIYDKIMDTNMRAAFHLTRLVAPELKKSRGNVVNISSVMSLKVFLGGAVSYSVSKAALDHFTRCAAAELGPAGVRVNSINPGFIVTEIFDKHGLTEEEKEALIAEVGKKHALGRCGQKGEVAKVVGFVASDDASFVTGATIPVDGGYTVFPGSN